VDCGLFELDSDAFFARLEEVRLPFWKLDLLVRGHVAEDGTESMGVIEDSCVATGVIGVCSVAGYRVNVSFLQKNTRK
jgi:hypothetical protein